jgi:hypothetical protein
LSLGCPKPRQPKGSCCGAMLLKPTMLTLGVPCAYAVPSIGSIITTQSSSLPLWTYLRLREVRCLDSRSSI